MRKVTSGNTFARRLFDGIAANYEGPAQLFSFFQYRRWRKVLVSVLDPPPGGLALDVCTGPGGVALSIARRADARVVGLDLSAPMLQEAHSRVLSSGLARKVSLVQGRAEDLPFPDMAFDRVVFTFLLRYVDRPQETISELARVLRPGGVMASLEFYVPRGPWLHLPWLLHTRVAMPLGTRFLSPGWREVGSFLGPSISSFYRQHNLQDLEGMWARAGLSDVHTRVLSLGGAAVTWGRKA